MASRNLIQDLSLVVGGVVLAAILIMAALAFEVNHRLDTQVYYIRIPARVGAGGVAATLEEKGIIKNKGRFKFLLAVFGQAKNLKAGLYELSPSMSLAQIIYKLSLGRVYVPQVLKLTIPEGTSIYKIGELLKRHEFKFAEEFQGLTDKEIPQNLKDKYPFLKEIKNHSLEGYLFPDTYFVTEDIEMYALVDLLLKRFSEMVIPYWEATCQNTSYALHQVVTLASIIEKEAVYDYERPVISSVFYNRLRCGMGLAADPTIKYALENPKKKVSLKDLQVNSPYNTYKYRGLPPGPICNPGYYSIKYAIFPDKTAYLFFVAKKDGTHIFSRTWTEHQIAIKKVRSELSGN